MTALHLFGVGTIIVWVLALWVIVRTENQGASALWVFSALAWTLALSVVAVTS